MTNPATGRPDQDQETPAPASQDQGPKPRKWDYRKFQKTFVEDPREGMATVQEIINRAEQMDLKDLKDLQKLLIAADHLRAEHI